MQLSRNSDYTLRVLLYLSVRLNERCTLSNVSQFYNISLEHLRKVVHQLSKMGYINTFQGKGGGFELADSPSNINIGDVIGRLEGQTPVIDCSKIDCRLSKICTLSSALNKAQNSFFSTLREYTLHDLTNSKAMVSELISSN